MDTHLLHVLSADRRASLLATASRPRPRRAGRWPFAAVARRSGAVTAGLLALVALGAAG